MTGRWGRLRALQSLPPYGHVCFTNFGPKSFLTGYGPIAVVDRRQGNRPPEVIA